MMPFTTLDRYIARTVLASVAMVVLVLLSLGSLFLFLSQQSEIGVGRYGLAEALVFVALSLPQQVWDLLPISALIGTLLGLGNLARGSELTVMRTAGWSVWRLARPAAAVGALLVLLAILVGEVLAPPLQEMARQGKTFAKFANVNFVNSGDAWVRDGSRLLNVERQIGEARFGGMMIYEIGADGRLAAVGRAVSASADDRGVWALEQYAETRFVGDAARGSRSARRLLDSALGAEFLVVAAASPKQLPTAVLWNMVHHLQLNGLDAREARYALWSRISRTAAMLFAVLLAVPFVLGSLRSSGAGLRVALGLVLGLGFFLLQRMLESGAVVFRGDPLIAAWAPTVLMASVALVLIARAR